MTASTPVLLLAQELGQGGSERQLATVARRLDRSRFAPHVGTLRPGGFRLEEVQRDGVPTVCFPVRSFGGWDPWREAGRLRRYVRAHDIRIIHSFDTPGNVFGMLAGGWSAAPVLLSSQRAFRDLVSPAFRRLLRISDRVSRGVVVNCQGLVHHMREEGVEAGRIHLCYNGIDTTYFEPGTRPAELAGASLTVGVVCALRPEKGLETLVEGFARMQHRPAGARLVIVGSGEMEEPLRRLAREKLPEEAVMFVPSTADVPYWLRGIDIFVLPSLSEALSNSLLEAMACGCVPVASAVGGNPELVEDGVSGRLFRVGDAAALSACLDELALAPERARQLAGTARQHVLTRFSVEASIRRMEEIYQTMLTPA